MKSLILQSLILAPFLVTSASAACQTTKVKKTLAWTYFVTGGPLGAPPPPLNYRNLTSPGRGYAWRERVQPSFDFDVTRPILLENDQDWKIVNCSSYFPPGDLGRQGCTSPDLALLAPPGGGKLGALDPKGVWAVYELLEFRITPVGPGTGDLQGEVQGWNENGGKVDMQFTIKNSQPGYRVKLTAGKWGSIVQWQVKLRSARSYTPEVGFVLDDVVIEEDAIAPSQDDVCSYPTQTPTAPPEPIKTLKFDDLPTGPAPTQYNGYTFNPPYQISHSSNAVSPPNVLSSVPDIMLSNRFLAKSFIFDIVSFHLTIKSTLAPADLNVNIQGYTPCYNIFTDGGIVGSSRYFNPTSLSFTVNTTEWGFQKHRGMDIRIAENASGSLVPFEVDNLVVRSWGEGPPKGGLGLPGCERCGKYLSAFCEYPRMIRTIQ